MVSTILPQFPKFQVNVSLFHDVQNSEDIRLQVAELPFAFVDASVIVSQEQLFAAVYRVLTDLTYNKLRTKTIHSECLLALSPTSNIGEAFNRFGIQQGSTDLVVLQIVEVGQESTESANDIVKGTEVEFNNDNLLHTYNEQTLRKIYKLDNSFQPKTTEGFSQALVNAIQLRGL
ncbi:hypothetical protein TPHA_0K00240 [Tetrapisispora phaffii CBS 4417]|uniref:EKC/KEOPS complex subunit CGI121 n=1 Tax=Tetrapisispora phaffii (strain ATCC 24235 / CBS 4417 / NBRC 1672 / NRRL Y-8282 / UCD 70-5) TaxID=1071381 RepID=G8BZ30_TETPH|nr:hypothetical protein TPHA_0K00240 [Tetrapisispora phaffii CBS 4417]CCE65158.1 hypothetical protein TPHA_0K00240 [Tetrapisispora phaffii CBS 4417]